MTFAVGLAVFFAVGFAVAFDVGFGVALASFFDMALLLFSFSRVLVPALPSAVRPLAFWKALTAASVPGPKSPSALPV